MSKKRVISKRMFAVVITVLMVINLVMANGFGTFESVIAQAAGSGTTYYVDAENGNDVNLGTTPEKAWKTLDRVNAITYQPGDKILFKAGCTWNGVLKPTGSGTEGAPIVIDKYGDGPKPTINGNGTAGPAITGTVLIYNEEYWEINNLEVTNCEPTDNPGELMDSGTAERAGILIYSSNQTKIYKHIRIRDCYVHDVNSSLQGMKTSGGIIVLGHYMDIDGNVVTIDDNGNLTPKAMGRAAYEDVIIEGNYVKNVAIEGIRNKCNTNIGSSGWGRNEFLKNFKNVHIRNNYLENVIGDGIVLTETVGGTVEGNMVNKSCDMDRGTVNYAQCWTMFADDIHVQYNEVYGNKYGYDDGEAFDSDMRNINNIYQYNLSHNNAGGACLFMSNQKDTTFRYNVSINDGNGTIVNGTYMQQQTFHYDNTSADGPGVPQIYNNTIYLSGSDVKTSLFGGKSKRTCFINFKNNIVLAENGATVTFAPEDGSTIHADSIIENNCFFPRSIADTNGVNSEALLAKGNIFEDPQLVNPQAGLTYADFHLDVANMADIYNTQDRVKELSKPYQLTQTSPCIYAGQRIGDAPVTDMWGNPIAGRVDIGAHEFSSLEENAFSVEEVSLATIVGDMPELPSKVNVIFTEGSEPVAYPVTWDPITEEELRTVGTIHLEGTLQGITNKAKATVIVTDTAKEIISPEVTTYAGVYPQLPKQVTVKFTNDFEMEMDVTWDKVDASSYNQAGNFEVKGTIQGLKQEAIARVTVIGKVGDGQTTSEIVASEDAFIQKGNPTTNYGKDAVLKVKNANAAGYNRRSLLKFNLSNNQELLDEATKIVLKLYVTRYDKDANYGWNNPERDQSRLVRIYDVSSDWSENKVTWDNAPEINNNTPIVMNDKEYVNSNIMDNGNILEIDITDYVKRSGKTEFSFLIGVFNNGIFASGDNSGFDFASKESSNAPVMEISNVYEKSVEAVEVTTQAFEAPVLPETVTVTYSNDTTKEVNVHWNAIDPNLYSQEGNVFTVEGKADGVSLPITATVTVKAAAKKITSVKSFGAIRALVGTKEEDLGLPTSAIAILDDNSEVELPIQYWFPEPAYNENVARDYAYVGHFDLTNYPEYKNPDSLTAAVTVTLVEKADKDGLQFVYDEATKYMEDNSVDKLIPSAKNEYMAAYEQAGTVLANDFASSEEVMNAYERLTNAMFLLDMVQADKTALGTIIETINKDDLSQYGKEELAVFQEVYDRAVAILDDEELTTADQETIDNMVKELNDAYEILKNSIEESTVEPTEESTQAPTESSDESTSVVESTDSTTNPPTGDPMQAGVWGMMAVIAIVGGASVVLVRRKREE
ncbi:MAG: Ig-like domain-containing protein [Lachnospiraceae bacterium]